MESVKQTKQNKSELIDMENRSEANRGEGGVWVWVKCVKGVNCMVMDDN